MYTSAAVFLIALVSLSQTNNAISEPYPWLHGGEWQNDSLSTESSPDPLVNYIWNLNAVNTSQLQIYNVTANAAYTDQEGSFANIASIYKTPNNVDVTVYGPGTITIDFGQENAAWFEIDSNDCDDQALMMSISEYNQPENVHNADYPKTLTPVKYTQNGVTTYRLETNSQLYDGVRFGFVHVSNQTNKPWHIIGVRAVSQILPTNYIGSFHSAQYPMLNEIWYSAAYCVKMNMLPSGFGAILLDRGDRIAWIGDNHISQRVAMLAFGAYDYVASSTIATQNNSNSILSYSLYWVLSVYDYYVQTNDVSLLKTVEYELQFKLNQSISLFGTNPSLSFYGWDERIGQGFEQADTSSEAQYAYQMLTIQTLGKAAMFWSDNALNNEQLSQYYQKQREQFIADIRADPNYLQKFGLHSSADAINGMWLNETETEYLFSKWFNDSVNICSFSPFNMFFIAQAMGNLNKTDYLLSSLDLCWGNSVRMGATTFWEVYSPEWNNWLQANDPIPNSVNGYTSECHPWSSGALTVITAYIAGFKIIEPGFQHIEIRPVLLQITADIPISNQQTISIDFDAYLGQYRLSIPAKMSLDIYLPMISENANAKIWPWTVSDSNVIDAKWTKIEHASRVYQMAHFDHLKPGQYVFRANFEIIFEQDVESRRTESANIPNVFPPPIYPCSVVGEDYSTKGNWIGRYGNEGYILFAYGSQTESLQKLPPYVTSIKPVDGTMLCDWTANASTLDPRALQDPRDPNASRHLGTIYDSPTYALNVEVDTQKMNGTSYMMSLYLCDFDDGAREQMIRIFDAATFNLAVPLVYNADFVEGKWITYKLDRSVRIRMNFVRGTNAVLSGIFFD